MKPFLSVAALVALMSVASAEAPRIARFSGDRAAAISYTFDDGLRDQYTLAVPMLNEVGFKGTFFVIPKSVAATVEDAEKRKDDKRAWGTITWDELRKMAAQGHEIGSHTWSHTGVTKQTPEQVEEELVKSRDAIAKEIGRPPLTLAFPFNQTTPEITAAALKHYIACRDSQLGVGGERSTVEWLDKWTDQQVRDHKWGVVMAHAIGSGYSAFTDPEILRTHLQHVKAREKEIWVDTFANVARYTRERDEAKLVLAASGKGSATFTLTSGLDAAVFNVPLTIVLDAAGATSAKAERKGGALPARVSGGVVQVDVTPGAEPVTVTWK
ncbi:polysaccharide deacetylase family protein [Luteolibacter sp. LG18]|uniref:polysaccharide deacetylase family protein n=1 Tax=Luteolibacter sp. LG18 TaxID=2819286 RepID=UPI002B2E52DA|nr:hypothetical protein llg_28300 [Luteolibacter sp. LG18]